MHNVAKAQRALDMAAEYVLGRETFGQKLADRQSVQFMLADCAAEIYKARLMLMHIAYKAENGLDMSQENSIAKIFLANMVQQVVDTALQLHGSLGYSRDTPLADWYTSIRSQRLVDGPDEVHRWKVGKMCCALLKKTAPRQWQRAVIYSSARARRKLHVTGQISQARITVVQESASEH